MYKINIGVNKNVWTEIKSGSTNLKIECCNIKCKDTDAKCCDCIFEDQEAKYTIEELKEFKRAKSSLVTYRVNIGKNGVTFNQYYTLPEKEDLAIGCTNTNCGCHKCDDCTLDGLLVTIKELESQGKAVKEGK